ncbi:MAG: GIY-YIG nuclease family protein [Deltaproteobacteria bacterium]|nr:GIY-YIG nuclease family protein [Deltaproteobacteria bacterium]
MALTPKTIQIFLPEGEPRGVRVAEVRNRTIQAIAMPRSKIETIAQWSEAEDCCTRIKEHNHPKDFWQTGITVTSKTRGLNKVHIKFLESHCLAACDTAGRYQLDNENRPSTASSIVFGMRSNGWTTWKDQTGRTLDALKRKL